LLSNTPDWFTPVIDWRKRELYQANTRVRALVGAPPLGIAPHTPPDILGMYVLVPAGARE
ncbi:MAG: hypothetical protein ACRDFX_10905, partial [Chloroflexota bacterium]